MYWAIGASVRTNCRRLSDDADVVHILPHISNTVTLILACSNSGIIETPMLHTGTYFRATGIEIMYTLWGGKSRSQVHTVHQFFRIGGQESTY